MDPQSGRAWICDGCGKPFRFDDRGLEAAKACCACDVCGGRGDMMGGPGRCYGCKILKAVEIEEQNVAMAQVRLTVAKSDKEKFLASKEDQKKKRRGKMRVAVSKRI